MKIDGSEQGAQTDASAQKPGIGFARFGTNLSMLIERVWPLALPSVLIIGIFLALSWFGLFRLMPDMARIVLGSLLAIGFAALLLRLRKFQPPTPAEIDRRVESANGLKHEPIGSQSDRIIDQDDPFAQALWREHKRRLTLQLGDLKSGWPHPRIPELDPYGLRALVLLLALVGFGFSQSPYGGRLTDVLEAAAPSNVTPPRIDAWVTPPNYTQRAPIFLTADGNEASAAFTIPENSDFLIRVIGGNGDEEAIFTDLAGQSQALLAAVDEVPNSADAGAAGSTPGMIEEKKFAGILHEDGKLAIARNGKEIRSWAFKITPDHPPIISFEEDPKGVPNGSLELNYQVNDDYGIASAEALLSLHDPDGQSSRPLYDAPKMPLLLPRKNGPQTRKTVRDLTAHPWAGNDIAIVLKATDGALQEARSEIKLMIMPERNFNNKLSRALIEQRRLLARDGNAKPEVLALMDAITQRPEDVYDTPSAYLAVMAARTRLKLARNDDQLRDVVSFLWDIALGIEDAALSGAEKRLQEAQDALRDALDQGADKQEIARLMEELRKAMDEYVQALAESQPPQRNQMAQGETREISKSELDRMMAEIERLLKSGETEKAREMLSQFEQMMRDLQASRPQQNQQSKQDDPMREQMNKLGDIMRRQQQMMNETFQLERQQRDALAREEGLEQGEMDGNPQDPSQNPDQNNETDQKKPLGKSSEQLAEELRKMQEGQQQLQKELQEFGETLKGMGMEPGEGFDDAGKAMGRSGEALGQGEGDRATSEQGEALEALRRGAQDMMQQMQQQAGEGDGQSMGQKGAGRDPLGRSSNPGGQQSNEDIGVPDEVDAQRARRILDAIRDRLGKSSSPLLERQYLERLLQSN